MDKDKKFKIMKVKKPTKIVLFILFTILLLGISLSIIVYINRAKEPINTVSGYLINITSLVIAVIALIIAMVTYFSIDSVNNVTAMGGNVLENPNYSIAYFEMVMQFRNCKNQKEFMDLLIEKINYKIEYKTSTCIKFADWVQTIIDHLIWFAYVDFSDKEFMNKCDKLITSLEKECERYNSLSNGIQYLLNENIKLIKYVLTYQKSRNLNQNQICYLENIRGKMIRNPISQIIYYDYLGLDYRRKANEILRKCGNGKKEFSFQYMKAINTYNYCQEDIRHFNILMNRANECFKNASKMAESDVLWQGYIQYNKARLRVMEYLIIKKNKKDVLNDINEVINTRETVCFLFDNATAFLGGKFKEEYEVAKSLYSNFKRI